MASYPTDQEAKLHILDIGRRMYAKNFVAANDGNISCKVGEDELWITPTGISKGFMSEEMLIKMRLDGSILTTNHYAPSSETKLHLELYQENAKINAVTHAHPPICTAYSIAGKALSAPIYPEALVNLGVVPCIHYTTPGSPAVAESIVPYAQDYRAVLLANHGAVCWGDDIEQAFYRLEAMEHYALIALYLEHYFPKVNYLSQEQIDALLPLLQQTGYTGPLPKGKEIATNLEDIIC